MGSGVLKPVICIPGNKVAQSSSVKSGSCIPTPSEAQVSLATWGKDPRRQILTARLMAFSETCYLSAYIFRIQLWEVYPLLIKLQLCLFKAFIVAKICAGVWHRNEPVVMKSNVQKPSFRWENEHCNNYSAGIHLKSHFCTFFAPAEPPTPRREITKTLCNGDSSMVPGVKVRLFISQDAKASQPPTAPSVREYWMNSVNSKAAEFFPLNLSSKTLAHLLK